VRQGRKYRRYLQVHDPEVLVLQSQFSYHIFQLTDVPRPGVLNQKSHHTIAERSISASVEDARVLAQKWRTSSGMSSWRRRSGGSCTQTPLVDKKAHCETCRGEHHFLNRGCYRKRSGHRAIDRRNIATSGTEWRRRRWQSWLSSPISSKKSVPVRSPFLSPFPFAPGLRTFQRFGHYGRTRYFHKAQTLVLRQTCESASPRLLCQYRSLQATGRGCLLAHLRDQALHRLHFRAYARDAQLAGPARRPRGCHCRRMCLARSKSRMS